MYDVHSCKFWDYSKLLREWVTLQFYIKIIYADVLDLFVDYDDE